MENLDNFIVRIYRRDKSDPGSMVGIVEDIESGRKIGFTSFGGLKKILGATEGRPPREKGGRLRGKARK